jgi:hypothetical protein
MLFVYSASSSRRKIGKLPLISRPLSAGGKILKITKEGKGMTKYPNQLKKMMKKALKILLRLYCNYLTPHKLKSVRNNK